MNLDSAVGLKPVILANTGIQSNLTKPGFEELIRLDSRVRGNDSNSMATAGSRMKILGIDPGSRITGFGLIEVEGSKSHYLASGCIRIKSETPALRLKEIFDGLSEIIETFHPDTAAIEQIFMHKSPDSALKLGQARGVAIVTLATHQLEVAEYSARQIKQAVVGYGAADKLQVLHMVKTLLNIDHTPKIDASDALAVALCHFHSSQSLLHLHGATKTVRGRLR